MKMNKYQEAIHDLKMAVEYPKSKYNDSRLIDLCFENIQELVEKATPKKPIMYKPRSVERPYCGFCNLRLKKSWIVCPRCATRIDWGDNDE